MLLQRPANFLSNISSGQLQPRTIISPSTQSMVNRGQWSIGHLGVPPVIYVYLLLRHNDLMTATLVAW
jgi:hypothetical protein